MSFKIFNCSSSILYTFLSIFPIFRFFSISILDMHLDNSVDSVPVIPSNALFKYNVHRYRLSDSPPAKRIYDRHARGERPNKIHKRFNVNYRRWPSWKSGFYYIYGKHAIFLKLGSARNFLPSCRILVSHLRFRPALERTGKSWRSAWSVDGNRLRRPGVSQKLAKKSRQRGSTGEGTRTMRNSDAKGRERQATMHYLNFKSVSECWLNSMSS